MRIGLSLPTFTLDSALTLDTAAAAESAGLDGVFVFDHLWPIGAPGHPALSAVQVLGAVAEITGSIVVGSLVMRVGLRASDQLVDGFATLAAAAGPERVIAGLGAGDSLSAAENAAIGMTFPAASERLAALAEVTTSVGAAGITTWIGGRGPGARAVAATHADALNVWGAAAVDVSEESADLRARAGERPVSMTWGGQVLIGSDPDDLSRRWERYGDRPGLLSGTIESVASELATLGRAGGLTWAVCAPLDVGSEPESAVANLAGVQQLLR